MYAIMVVLKCNISFFSVHYNIKLLLCFIYVGIRVVHHLLSLVLHACMTVTNMNFAGLDATP